MEVSPILIPVLGICIPIVAIIFGAISQMHNRRLKADQRMALLARGMAPQDIENFLRTSKDVEQTPKDPMRSLGNARRAAIILISIGLGVIAFFCALVVILHEHDVLSGAACGLIPLFIGLGFIVDYQLQKREMSRFGLEIDQEPTPRA